jgi:Flp pilus assembly pilin Flp
MIFDYISTKIRNLHRDQRGTTLVETLVAAAISVIVFGVITTIMVQFLLVTRWGNSKLETSNDIQVASLWLGRDALESSSFTPGSGTVYGTLSWPDSSNQFRYSYNALEDTLVREFIEDGLVQTSFPVARYILDQTDVVFSSSGALLSVSITSTSGEEINSVNLQLSMRAR